MLDVLYHNINNVLYSYIIINYLSLFIIIFLDNLLILVYHITYIQELMNDQLALFLYFEMYLKYENKDIQYANNFIC